LTDPVDASLPPTSSRPRRTRRFVLPEHHHDERATEHIEAFLDGPTAAARRRPPAGERKARPVKLDTRPDWSAALRLEAARHVRYGRPASVVIIALARRPNAAGVDRVARALADVIRTEIRETDRAVRIGAADFRLLLPETGSRAARTVAERLDRAFRADPNGWSGEMGLCIEVASAPRHGSLEEALTEAEQRLAGRLEPR
jgi:hypothetical protein